MWFDQENRHRLHLVDVCGESVIGGEGRYGAGADREADQGSEPGPGR